VSASLSDGEVRAALELCAELLATAELQGVTAPGGPSHPRSGPDRIALARSVLRSALAGLDAREEQATAGLTPREREVFSALASGATPTQIARELGISPRTVHKHLEHVYRKLDVTHRGAAISRVVQR
jgi:DNA-binding CsgD family transcriptional regulator